jgi:hypothetical protein
MEAQGFVSKIEQRGKPVASWSQVILGTQRRNVQW